MNKKVTMSKGAYLVMVILASVGIGMICTSVTTCLADGFNQMIMRNFIWISASVLYGLASYLIFSGDRLSLPVATALHCMICLAVTFAACRFCRFETEESVWGRILVMFVIIYIIIYLAFFAASKIEAKKINDKINKEN